MNEKMKILIGYDGSDCSDAALEDLERAGLTGAADAYVITVADVFVPPPINEKIDNTFPMYVPDGVKRAHKRAERKLEEAEAMAKRAGDKIKQKFPEWNVRYEAVSESPAWAIISTADQWKPDLVVVGAHGHSVLGGRLILGSISQRVLYEAPCSVRIARGHSQKTATPVRLLIGVDNSTDSNAAIDAVCQRSWPKGTEVRLLR